MISLLNVLRMWYESANVVLEWAQTFSWKRKTSQTKLFEKCFLEATRDNIFWQNWVQINSILSEINNMIFLTNLLQLFIELPEKILLIVFNKWVFSNSNFQKQFLCNHKHQSCHLFTILGFLTKLIPTKYFFRGNS